MAFSLPLAEAAGYDLRMREEHNRANARIISYYRVHGQKPPQFPPYEPLPRQRKAKTIAGLLKKSREDVKRIRREMIRNTPREER